MDAADGLQAKIRCVYDAMDMGSSRRHDNGEDERRRFYVGADMARPGDETTRSRARIPKSDNIQSYDRRHGLRRAPEGGRRMDGRADVGGVGPVPPEEHASCRG